MIAIMWKLNKGNKKSYHLISILIKTKIYIKDQRIGGERETDREECMWYVSSKITLIINIILFRGLKH